RSLRKTLLPLARFPLRIASLRALYRPLSERKKFEINQELRPSKGTASVPSMASGAGRLACYLGIRGRDGARPSDPAREQRYKCQPAVSAPSGSHRPASPARTLLWQKPQIA